MIAKSLVRLILCWVAGGPLHFERRKAVESSFRGSPATFPKHKPFGQNFWQLLYACLRANEYVQFLEYSSLGERCTHEYRDSGLQHHSSRV